MSAKIFAAIIEAQKKVKPVQKDGRNEYHKYDYVTAEAMIEDCRTALAECGVTPMPFGWTYANSVIDLVTENGEPYKQLERRISVRIHLVHADGDQIDLGEYSIAVVPEKGRPVDKAESAARTYILSYFLRDLLLVPRIDREAQVDQRDDRNWQPGYPSPRGQAAVAASNAPEMASRAQQLQTEMLAAKDETLLESLRATAKKEMRGQYLEACKKAYSRRKRELMGPQTNGATAQ